MLRSINGQRSDLHLNSWVIAREGWVAILGMLLFAYPFPARADSLNGEPGGKTEERTAIEQLTQTNQMLVQEIEELRARMKAIEEKEKPADPAPVLESPSMGPISSTTAPSPAPAKPGDPPQDDGGHNMDMPGGPKLNIRGFLDFNLGVGSVANPLIYPLTIPPTPVHNGFQFGEFDLFMSSRLSSTLSFLSEVVLGSDASNFWGLDVERAQLTYKPSEYFQLSFGRMHTSIGFYNTAYHHGTWFSTATGRPFMYYFEDSGGILPVHIVGVEAEGLLPHSGKFNAHWIAEVGNGTSSLVIGQPIVNQPVQNFQPDKNHKAYNIAGYIRPDWVSGLQIGANYYNDVRVPDGVPHVNNSVVGAYLVYITTSWEFLNEFQLQRDHSFGSLVTYNTPLGYTQISRKFGKFRPYFRWQEVNVPNNDPLYGSVGRYEGPSEGLRVDFFDYAALKVQYNRIYTRNPLPMNGVDTQISFTF